MAWMRMMGVDSVEYHRQTVLARGDDHPGQALAYYASRGETPLCWGGRGAPALGLVGAVTDEQYEAVFGPGGARDPATGERLVNTKRPGLELVVSAHKSVAELGVIGRAEDMHRIMDAERDATLAYLDQLTGHIGGRRGKHNERTPTDGMIYAVTRHATSRAGDPCPHDHVLVANVVGMADEVGGWKGADTALWREHVHAATMVGRVASAAKAVELGYAVVADPGPSGRLGHWAITGVPEAVMEVHSKRAAEIEAEMERTGYHSYQARNIATRATRDPKRHTPVGELMPRWVAEIGDVGWCVERVAAAVEREAAERERPWPRLTNHELRAAAEAALDADGPLAARKVFTKRDVIVAVAPQLYGRNLSELGRVVERTLADPETVPLLGVPGAHQRAYATAMTIAREQAVARSAEALAANRAAAAVSPEQADAAIARAEASLDHALTLGQRRALESVLQSGRGVELIVGVAGSGKTTALAACRDGFEAAGYEVVGTSTSGQAARTLGREAGIAGSRTLASLNWRISHDQLHLTPRTVAVLDEAAMTDDAGLAAFLQAARVSGTKVVMVGDHRQLSSVGPGGGFEALLRRYGDNVHLLGENVRQVDPEERAALAKLRAGKVEAAVDWYAANGRIAVRPDRDTAVDAVVEGWAADVSHGADAAMYAWRRANVAELNRWGRVAWDQMGGLSGPELLVGSTPYQAGDRIVTLAPGGDGSIVTSECGTVLAVDVRRRELAATMDDGRIQRFAGDDLDADHLAHGYAVTVHRSQGSTVQRAHAFEDGGGRELAYVKMSRARECSTVYVVADSMEQAADDLRGSWAQSRRVGWAIDQGTPAPGRADPAVIEDSLQHARLVVEREALAAGVRRDFYDLRMQAEAKVEALTHRLQALDNADGWGPLRGTEVGEAAIAWRAAVDEWRRCHALAKEAGPLEAHRLRRQADRAAEREGPLRDRYEALTAPERERIRAELPEARKALADLDGVHDASRHFAGVGMQFDALDPGIYDVAYDLDLARERLDGIAPEPQFSPTPQISWGPVREPPREPLGLDRGIDRGIGLEL